jgi:hypothetical protein
VFALGRRVSFKVITRCALVLLPLIVCAGRLQAQRSRSPESMTQEVNRCLSMVRVAASRRRTERRGTETAAPQISIVRRPADQRSGAKAAA